MGTYLRWTLIKFTSFSASASCLFCNKTINGDNKTRRCNNLQSKVSANILKKILSSGKSLISTSSISITSISEFSGAAKTMNLEIVHQ